MSTTAIELSWVSGELFSATNQSGLSLTLDGDKEAGFSPTEALLSSLAACMGIDVVIILEKMRLGPDGLHISIQGERIEEPPRYFRRVRIRFRIVGNVPQDKAQRAVDLSFDKYCSVFHTLREDLEVETELVIENGLQS